MIALKGPSLRLAYLAQIYSSCIAILALPVLAKYMGPEAYGLVGFFTVAQIILQFLDLGLSAAVSRELSRFKAGSTGPGAAMALLQAAEWLLAAIVVVVGLTAVFAVAWLATEWFSAEGLARTELERSLVLLFVACGLRVQSGLYRGALIGMERQAWANGCQAVFATLKYPVAIAVVALATDDALSFFAWQVLLAACELLLLRFRAFTFVPAARTSLGDRLQCLRDSLPFAINMTFLSAVWVALTQLDKVMLSKVLTLAEFGYFSLAMVISGAVLILATPVSQLIQPRFTIHAARQDLAALVAAYRSTTQYFAVGIGATAMTVAFLAAPVLTGWLGEASMVARAAPYLLWYGLGNGIVALLMLPFAIQFAFGDLSLHRIGNCLFGLVWIPALFFVIEPYGAVGTGVVWFLGNLAFLILWVPRVHRRFIPALGSGWLLKDVAWPVAAQASLLLFVSHHVAEMSRLQALALVSASWTAALFVGTLAAPIPRARALAYLRHFRSA